MVDGCGQCRVWSYGNVKLQNIYIVTSCSSSLLLLSNGITDTS